VERSANDGKARAWLELVSSAVVNHAHRRQSKPAMGRLEWYCIFRKVGMHTDTKGHDQAVLTWSAWPFELRAKRK